MSTFIDRRNGKNLWVSARVWLAVPCLLTRISRIEMANNSVFAGFLKQYVKLRGPMADYRSR